MNIPPILERLLLSNEAVFKNASLGLTGENMVLVPPGKTAVLLEFSIEPFSNDIENSKLFELGTSADSFTACFVAAKERLLYQMQIISDNYATYFSFHEGFSIVNNVTGVGTTKGTVTINFSGKREELFIYTDRSVYFNFLYPYKENEEGPSSTGITQHWGHPNPDFLPKIQVLPKSPISFNNNANIDFLTFSTINSPSLDAYYPVNNQLAGITPSNFSQMEYLRFFAGFQKSSIKQPQPNGEELDWASLFQLPLVNVKYALINKRASDYGIVAPKNL
jgi:hypothetical protein